MNKLISVLIAKAKIIFIFSLVICSFLTYEAKNIQIEAKSTSFFLADDPDLKAFFQTEKDFGEQDYLVAAKDLHSDAFSANNIKLLKEIKAKIEAITGKGSTLSILNAPLFLSKAPSIEQNADIKLAKKEILENEIFAKNLISTDATTISFIITGAHKDDLKALRHLAKSEQLELGGMSIIVDRMIAYIKSDLSIYGACLLVLLAFAVWVFFGSFYYVFVCVFICGLSLAASTGIFALSNYAITVISSNYVALVLIISISVVIHLLSHFSELYNKSKQRDLKLIIRHTLLAKAKPSFYAILTTVVGFLSLVFSGIVPISELGTMMSIGIVFSLILCYLLMPYLLMYAPAARSKVVGQSLLNFSAHCALHRRPIIYAISIIALVICAFAIPRLHAENSFANYFKDSSEIKRGLKLIDEKLGGTLPLDVILIQPDEADKSTQASGKGVKSTEASGDDLDEFFDEIKSQTYFLTQSKIADLIKVQDYLQKQEHVGSVLSLASLAKFAEKINPAAKDTLGINILLNNLDKRSYDQIVKPYYNKDKKLLRLVVRMKDSDKTLRRGEFLAKLHKELPALTNAKVQISGVMVLYNNMLASLVHSQVDTLSFVVASIFALFLIIFKNLRFSIIGIIANVVPLSALFSIIAFCNLKLDLMSITIAAISIGIGVDDIIHYVHRFKEEIKRKNLTEAILATHTSIGSALFYTTTTVVLGFMLMMSSNFIPTIYFGLLTVLIMILLLCGSLFLLPSLIISLHANGYFKAEFKEK